jgi:hypothetical protein
MTMNKESFCQYCFKQLLLVFNNSLKGLKDEKLKYRTEGLLQAGQVLGLLSRTEASALMEKAHLQVFGQTIEARKNYKDSVKKALILDDSDFFNIPAIERRKIE